MASETVSIRVPSEIRRWLERFSRSRGSISSSAARLLEEAKRREQFRFVDYRDTPLGRLAYVQGSRVPVYLAAMAAKDHGNNPEKLAAHYDWSLAKAESVLAYAEAFDTEIDQNIEDHQDLSDFDTLKRTLPGLHKTELAG